jgi:hypothetical protein
MSTTVRARFAGGVLRPLEDLSLREGDEVMLTIVASEPSPGGAPEAHEVPGDWLDPTAGGWRHLIDAERLKQDIYESRLVAARAEPRL